MVKILPRNLIRSVLAGALLTYATVAGAELSIALKAYQERDFDSAIATLEKLADEDASRDVLFHLARIQHRAGHNEDASDTLASLFEQHPDDAEAQYLSGLVSLSLVGEVNIFRKVGMAKKALAAWEKAVDIDPEHLNARYAIFAYYANAPGIAGGDKARASELQRELAAVDPGFGAMANGLLNSLDDTTHAEAEASFLSAIQLMDRAGPHFALAQFYMQTEQYDKVLPQIELFSAKEKRWWDPDVTVVHLVLARSYAALGNNAQAEQNAQLGLSLRPTVRVREMLEETLESLL